MAWRYSNSKVIAVLLLLNLLSAHTLAEAKSEAFSSGKMLDLPLQRRAKAFKSEPQPKTKKGQRDLKNFDTLREAGKFVLT